MKKLCGNCQTEYEDGQRFCPHCGAPIPEEEFGVKTAVEWVGGTVSPYAYLSMETQEEKKEREKRQKTTRVIDRKKKLFTLSFVALLLDFICGIGWFLGVYVVAQATADDRFLRKEEKKRSAKLVWAMTVGYIATLLGLLFFLLLF